MILKNLTTFKIPCLPVSNNAAYAPNFRTKRMHSTHGLDTFKNSAIVYIPPVNLEPNKHYYMSIEYHGKFLNKDGTTKKRDAHNFDKALIDLCFDKWGIDDCHIWGHIERKFHHDTEEYTLVSLEVREEDKNDAECKDSV